MRTLLENASKKKVDELMVDPEWMVTLSDYLKKLRSGYYSHANIIMQKWERETIDLYDAYPFAMTHINMMTAKVVCATIEIGESPYQDAAIKENNEILKRLWHPFEGVFWGGTQDEDGYIEVKEPIKFDMLNQQSQERTTREYSGSFPLEVGYISATKTMYYLNSGYGRLARWPYESECIYLLQNVEKA